MSVWTTVPFVAGDKVRGGTGAPNVGYVAKSLDASFAWGARPAVAKIEYIEDQAQVPIVVGSALTITIPDTTRLFYGVCVRDFLKDDASGGRVRELTFHDSREFLGYDAVFCVFNRRDVRMVNGVVRRRFWSILPANFVSGLKTFHDAPYTAAEVVPMLFGAGTVFSPWETDAESLALLAAPVYELDWSGGVKLEGALAQLSERLSLVFTNQGGRWRLEWARKGQGDPPETTRDPMFAGSNDRRLGWALSGQPTGVRVVGDRNLYQVMNVPLRADWAAGWEVYWDWNEVRRIIYENGTTQGVVDDIPAGTRYNAITGDTEHLVGWQLASARANEMTVGEFAAFMEGLTPGSGATLTDTRMFNGASRMLLPAALYLKLILFRAFRMPADFGFPTAAGAWATVPSAELTPRLLTRVAPDAVTGNMVPELTGIIEGTGYAMVQGYNVATDLFRILNPARFDPARWQHASQLWQSVNFQVDDSGEDGGFVLFDAPVVVSADIVERLDGHAVVRANGLFTAPAVKATLVFAGERYWELIGTADRVEVENVPSLYGEFVVDYVTQEWWEVPYADGETAAEKAAAIGNARLGGALIYCDGGMVFTPGYGEAAPGMPLTSLIDRVSYRYNAQGWSETVDFTKEAGPGSKWGEFVEDERSYERRSQLQRLAPGQAELNSMAEKQNRLALGLRRNRGFARTLSEAFQGQIGRAGTCSEVLVENGAGTLAAGTPLFGEPMAPDGGGVMQNTRAVMPAATGAAHTVFRGVVLRQNEPANRPVAAQVSGPMLARVLGPVAVGDAVGRSNGHDYLAVDATVTVGVAQQAITSAVVQLITIDRIGGGGGGDCRWS